MSELLGWDEVRENTPIEEYMLLLEASLAASEALPGNIAELLQSIDEENPIGNRPLFQIAFFAQFVNRAMQEQGRDLSIPLRDLQATAKRMLVKTNRVRYN